MLLRMTGTGGALPGLQSVAVVYVPIMVRKVAGLALRAVGGVTMGSGSEEWRAREGGKGQV